MSCDEFAGRGNYAMFLLSVWMHAATRGCVSPADSSVLAAGVSGWRGYFYALPLRRRSVSGLRLTPSPVPQCRLRPTVTVHPCLRSVTHSLLAGPRGRAPQCRPRAKCTSGPCTLIHTRRARLAISEQAARVGCWTGRGRRRADVTRAPGAGYW